MPRKKASVVDKVDIVESKLNLVELKLALDNAEKQIKIAKKLIFSQLYSHKAAKLICQENVIEGIFDGEDMVGADSKKYVVPSNYASKSKLVAGDVMKLTIGSDGVYVYKQIGPVERKRLTGILCETDGGYCVEADGKIYNILGASISFFKARNGDKIALLVAKDQESNWAAVDNKITDL